MRKYNANNSRWFFYSPAMKLTIISVLMALLSIGFKSIEALARQATTLIGDTPAFGFVMNACKAGETLSIVTAIILILSGIVYQYREPTRHRIKRSVCRRLFDPRQGNPLKLKKGTILPKIRVSGSPDITNEYLLKISTESISPDTLIDLPKIISSALTKQLEKYAVTVLEQDIAANYVQYVISDVKKSKKLVLSDKTQVRLTNYRLQIQQNYFLDFRTAGSILLAAKTRAGKTTAAIYILSAILKNKPDRYGSQVVIIDPKKAELSVLPQVLAPTDNGDVHEILSAVKAFDGLRIERQKILNNISAKTGQASKWHDMGMQTSIIFIDEWVSLVGLIPTKALKNDPEYCLDAFMKHIKNIVTMGASAGCFVMISTAQASVGEANIPSMIRNAMKTKILLLPTKEEGAFLWDSQLLDALPDRAYKAGDAWMSIDDGVHNRPSFVQFPDLRFEEYMMLNDELHAYYLALADNTEEDEPGEGAAR